MITLKDGSKTLRLQDFNMRAIREHARPRSGKISHLTQHIPGRTGDWYFGSEVGVKTYELQANTLQTDWEKLEKQLDQLTAFLFDSKGRPKLVEVHWDNTKKFSYVRLQDAIVPDVASVMEKIPIVLVNFDSNEYAKSNAFDPEKPLRYDEGHEYGVLGYPNTQSFNWNIIPNHYSAIENYSAMDTDITITIRGTIRGASIKHLRSNKTLKLPNITNGTIVIETETYNLRVNGSDVLEFEGDFFEMVEGNNGFLFKAEQASATVSFDWLHKFM